MLPHDRKTLTEIFRAFGERIGPDFVVCKTYDSVCGNEVYISLNFKSLVTGLETLSEIQVENRLMEIRAFYHRLFKKGSSKNNFKKTIRTKAGIFKVQSGSQSSQTLDLLKFS